MAVVWVRAFGSLRSYYAEEGGDIGAGMSLTFPQERVRMEEVFVKLHIPVETIGLVAINNVKCAKDAWVVDGDKVTIFPLVAGG